MGMEIYIYENMSNVSVFVFAYIIGITHKSYTKREENEIRKS
jgi:hypothetical protein